MVSSGEKPTGGYDIDIKSIEDGEGVTQVLVKETVPGKDSMNTTALTYPYVIVKFKGTTGKFRIVNEDGEVFATLNDKPAESKIKPGEIFEGTGTYNGQIDSNSIEIEVNGEARAFMIYDVKDQLANISEGERVSISYYKNENGQLMVISLEKFD
ncbi:hypothetical protein N752_01275 [Desulforamulus aquiferis]|nr:protease complex subunit PrcB family protein [Desulforamulus aquiferis]RYD06950.1 hypothetical protein N752_01275 [Desulforamulus aquiferis]